MSRLAVGDPMNAQGDVGCRGQIVSPEKMVEWCRILRHCLTIYIGGPYRQNSKEVTAMSKAGKKTTRNRKHKKKVYLRGEVYFADLGEGIGSEQRGERPVVIIQNDVGNKYSPTVIVAPITTRIKGKSKLPTHYYLNAGHGIEEPSTVLLEQLRTIDKQRLGNRVGKLSDKQMKVIDRKLAVSVGLERGTRNEVGSSDLAEKQSNH